MTFLFKNAIIKHIIKKPCFALTFVLRNTRTKTTTTSYTPTILSESHVNQPVITIIEETLNSKKLKILIAESNNKLNAIINRKKGGYYPYARNHYETGNYSFC